MVPGARSPFVCFFGCAGHIPALLTLQQKFSPAENRMARIKREQAQDDVAALKKRTDASLFQIGDKVRVRSPASGKWDKVGFITDVVKGPDDVARSFLIKLEGGDEHYRH